MNTIVYEKPEAIRYSLGRLLGDGLLVVEGDKHRQQVCNGPLMFLHSRLT